VVVLLGMSPRFIDIKVKDVSLNSWYRITFVYGEPQVESCHLKWETLHRLHTTSNLRWLVVGDFNEIMWGLSISQFIKGLAGRWRSSRTRFPFVICMTLASVVYRIHRIMAELEGPM
jgi:hypothetical protein